MTIFKLDAKNTALLPEYFTLKAIPLEVQAFNQSILEQTEKMPSLLDLSPQDIRVRDKNWTTPSSSIASDRYITDSIGNKIKLRVLLPDKIKGVYLFIHGGGWISGAADWQDTRLENIANEAQLAVVSVEYRLAPEHPYPTPVDDCEAAALWLVENAMQEFGTQNILIGGGSAGAHLAALTLLRMRDKHSYKQFKGANLVFGMYDLNMTPSMRNWGSKELILSTPIVNKLLDYFVPKNINRCDPTLSPLYADLHNMPPTLFTVGTADPLLDDTLFMYMRWLSAGNQAELAICPGGIHGFITMPTPQADQARENVLAFLKRCL